MIKAKAASGDDPCAVILISVFFIKIGFIPIRPKQNVRHPVRRSAHLFTDSFQVNSGVAFNNQFIMDVSDDEAVAEGFHSIAEYVAADGLDDILHKFRPIRFDAFPLLCRTNAFIGDRFSSELVCGDSWFYICKPAS